MSAKVTDLAEVQKYPGKMPSNGDRYVGPRRVVGTLWERVAE